MSHDPSYNPSRKKYGAEIPISRIMRQFTDPVFKRYGFINSEIIEKWPHIIGPFWCEKTRPLKIQFQKYEQKEDGVLYIQAPSSFAVILSHIKSDVLQRVNAFFGYRAVVDLRIEHGFKAQPQQQNLIKEIKELSPDTQEALSEKMKDIEDAEIRQALFNLAKHLY